MKQSLSILLILLALTASGQSQKQFRIVDATAQPWAGGMRQSGHGTSYALRIVLLTATPPNFTNAWVGDKLATGTSMLVPISDDHRLAKGDTIAVRFSVNVIPQENPTEVKAKPAPKPPCHYKGQALLAYTVGRKTKYVTIDKFVQLPPRNYP